MGYIEKATRGQVTLLPDIIEDYISEENPVRVISAFVETLDLEALGVSKSRPAATGRPAYDLRDLLKLYVYGYFNKIRSSRRLMAECGRNVELFWLVGKLTPDFRTIADFRKENAKALRQVFRAFVRLCVKMGLYKRELLAVDGTKVRAHNSDDNCYNEEVLEKKLRNIDKKLARYLAEMDAADHKECEDELTAKQVSQAVAELKARKGLYESYLSELQESGETQILTTDPEARRMHSKDGFHCCYNVQTAVDSDSHLIAEYEVTNHNTDQGLLTQVCNQAKETLGVETIEAVADKGYESRNDIENCMMSGTMPQVALKYDKDERIFNIPYENCEIKDEFKVSKKPEDIQKCLHAGILPDCYKNTTLSVELQSRSEISCFIRNADNTVTCPAGKILSPIKYKENATIYASKEACRQCKNRCTASRGRKTVSFGPETDCVPVIMYGQGCKLQQIPENARISPYNHTLDRTDYSPQKTVVIRIKDDKEKLKQRMCTVEHPFGTVKWYDGAHFVLCNVIEKATAELGLSFLAYNLKRAIKIMGVPTLIAAMRG